MTATAIRTTPVGGTITCPRCGSENRPDRRNCEVCRINLKFALENPAEIARLRQAGAGREPWLDGRVEGETAASATRREGLPPSILLLFGSFVFAFCLGEAVHELGHFLTHRAYGVEVGMVLDPFGASRILHGSAAPQEILGITSAAGPLLNLLAGLALSLSLWHLRRPALLPLLLWGPVALVQEGVTFSLGLLTSGGDAQLVVDWGVPAPVLLGLGFCFLATGVALLCGLLPLVGLSSTDPFGRKLGIVAGGMVSFLLIRLLVSSSSSPAAARENTAPLLFSLLLAALVALLFRPLASRLGPGLDLEPSAVTWPAAMSSLALALGMVLFQMTFLN